MGKTFLVAKHLQLIHPPVYLSTRPHLDAWLQTQHLCIRTAEPHPPQSLGFSLLVFCYFIWAKPLSYLTFPHVQDLGISKSSRSSSSSAPQLVSLLPPRPTAFLYPPSSQNEATKPHGAHVALWLKTSEWLPIPLRRVRETCSGAHSPYRIWPLCSLPHLVSYCPPIPKHAHARVTVLAVHSAWNVLPRSDFHALLPNTWLPSLRSLRLVRDFLTINTQSLFICSPHFF